METHETSEIVKIMAIIETQETLEIQETIEIQERQTKQLKLINKT